MRYGKFSTSFLAAAGLAIVAMIVLRPGLGNLCAILAGLLILVAVPLSAVFGILWILSDKQKRLAIITTAGSIGLIFFNISMELF